MSHTWPRLEVVMVVSWKNVPTVKWVRDYSKEEIAAEQLGELQKKLERAMREVQSIQTHTGNPQLPSLAFNKGRKEAAEKEIAEVLLEMSNIRMRLLS